MSYNSTSPGFTIVEAVIAIALVALGVVGMLQLIPLGWQNTESSNTRTRLAEVMQREMESTQALIMNPCNIVAPIAAAKNTTVSGLPMSEGDLTVQVAKTIAANPVSALAWDLTITVSRGSSSVRGFRTVTRQNTYRFPSTCNTAVPAQVVDLLAAGSEG
jgi:Tfp pilus assembly protein PilV